MKNKALYILILLTGLVSFEGNAQVIDKIIAKVDNEIVLKSELEQAYIQFMAQQQKQTAGEDVMCSVFETLIINKLLLAKADIDSVTIDRETVEAELERRMDHFVMQAGGDPKKLEDYYGKSLDQLKQELKKVVKEQMIVQKMQDKITSSVKVTPGEVKKFYNDIPKDSLPYFSTEVEVGQIVIIPNVTKEQKAEARAKAEKIRAKLIAGEDFCELAKQNSQDVGSAVQCGEIGWFKKGDLVAPYEAAALSLKDSGAISLPTESEYGFHVIQLMGRRGNEFSSRHILIKASTSTTDLNAAEILLDSLREVILKDKSKFGSIAHKNSDDKETSNNGGLFTDQTIGGTKIAMENLAPDIFFVIDTMEVGHITKPMRFKLNEDDDKYAVRIVYYKSKTPPHQANLVDDYQKIYKATLTEKKNNAVNEWFDKTKNEVFFDIDPEYHNCEILITQ